MRSKFEKEVKKKLDKTFGSSKVKYEPYSLTYTITRKYLPDFVIERKEKEPIYIEVKGYFDYNNQVKIKAIKDSGYDIRMVFMKDNKIRRGSNLRYSDWCKKHNIPFCIQDIPEDWNKG